MLIQDPIKAYQTVEQDLLVEGADPHSLVQILFAEFLVNIEMTIAAIERSDLSAKSAHITKAMMACHLLASSLDYAKGGEVAVSLGEIYEWSRRKLLDASIKNSVASLQEVHQIIGDISGAWNMISAKAA